MICSFVAVNEEDLSVLPNDVLWKDDVTPLTAYVHVCACVRDTCVNSAHSINKWCTIWSCCKHDTWERSAQVRMSRSPLSQEAVAYIKSIQEASLQSAFTDSCLEDGCRDPRTLVLQTGLPDIWFLGAQTFCLDRLEIRNNRGCWWVDRLGLVLNVWLHQQS